MATRKELLEDLNAEMDRLSTAVSEGAEDLSSVTDAAASRLDESLRMHSQEQRKNAASLARGISQAGDSLVAAAAVLVVGGIVNTIVAGIGRAVALVLEEVIDLIKEEGERTQMINSIRALQENYPRMSYKFLIKRTFVSRTGRRQRETILNGLISDGIVTTNRTDGQAEWFTIEEDNPALIDHWERIDAVRESIQEAADSISRSSSRPPALPPPEQAA
jgi:hypothetical protein